MTDRHGSLFIDGRKLEAANAKTSESYDPATGAVFATYAVAGLPEVEDAVAAARASYERGTWRRLRPFERGRILHRIADGLTARRDEIAHTIVLDSGKPLRDAYWEVDCSARFFEFYAGICDKPQGSSIPLGDGIMDWTIKEPIGVSAQIVPWNYPLQVAIRGVAPALAVGCSVVIKPSVETPLSLDEFVEITAEAGLPPGVLNVITGPGSTIGDALVRHEGVDQVTFTGSVPVGVRVIQAAATHCIPTNMELGGKSPQLVFADCDLERTLPIIAAGMYTHAGQVCNAGTRLLIEDKIHDEVVERLHKIIQSMTIGAGIDDPDLGPLVSSNQQVAVQGYMDLAQQEGVLLQGSELPRSAATSGGYFVRPGIVVGAGSNSRVAKEEVFGPLLTAMPFNGLDEAIAVSNDSEFGLVAGVFTSSIDIGMRAAQELRAGQVWINSFGVGLDVEFPFGGYKRSGFGREKGVEALGAYQQVKNICVAF